MPLSNRRLLNSFTDVIFPPLCPFCRLYKKKQVPTPGVAKNNLIEKDGLCLKCRSGVIAITSPMCAVCGEPFKHVNPSSESAASRCGACLKDPPPYSQARSGFAYVGKLQQAIHHFKYNGQTLLAPMLAALASTTAGKLANALTGSAGSFDKIVPVPLHKNRLRRRGFNQSLLLARELIRILPSPDRPELDYQNLQRTRDTRSQIELKEKERAINVKDAFAVKDAGAFKDKKVLLIDDVYTSGATIRECSKVLRSDGAEVFALTLARVVRV